MEVWKFLAGLGLFLYGMNLMEHVLKKVSGRSFKLFLRKYTQSLFKSIVGGTLITGLVQSSSVVSLLVLAFVGAGIITYRNALGVILGSNLGTTLTSWIVATVGFKLNIESFSLPVIAFTAIVMFFVHRRKKIYNILRIFFSIGILFLGFGFMKTGAESLVGTFDLGALMQYNTLVFVLAGFILTTIIQASSASVAIALTALNANAIGLPAAAAFVIGSELGTTIKIVLAASNGSPDKKRVAWGNFIFNITTTVAAYLALPWLLYLIQEIILIHDPLIALVFFQSTINLLTIILFLPLINPLAKWLEGRFKNDVQRETSFISRDLPIVGELVMDALYHETELLIKRTSEFHTRVLSFYDQKESFLQSLTQATGSTEDHYDCLKKIEGEILHYYSTLQPEDLDREQHDQINQYITAVRHSIHAAKSIKDIQHNLKDLSNSGNDALHEHYATLQKNWNEFDISFHRLLTITDTKLLFEELTLAMKVAFSAQVKHNTAIVTALKERKLTEIDTSTLMNVEREVLSGKKSLLRALSHLKLTHTQADVFEFLPEEE
jgi:phosphate:Na+ symporter